MQETLLVSSRGQITLPASMRKHLGIESGAVLVVEERNGELTLRPAVVLGIEHYSDEQITRWDSEDVLSAEKRLLILSRLQEK